MSSPTFEGNLEKYFKGSIRLELNRQDIIFLALGICGLMNRPDVRGDPEALKHFREIGRRLLDSVKVDGVLPIDEEFKNEFLRKGLI